jgi:asparagine N-glycosylation enzyme membrane subunit Stt3
MSATVVRTIKGERHILLLGRLSAWTTFVIFIVYAATLFAGGVVRGLPKEPYFALAEVITIISAIVLVILMAAIHLCTSIRFKIFSLLALGWMFITAGITVTVHLAELTVARQLDPATRISFARFFDFEWPSLLYGIEFVAWHIGFGLSVLFAAFAFQGNGAEKVVRVGLIAVGLLCLIGFAGPAFGDLNLRLIGVFGYGIVFPIICIWIALVFKNASLEETNSR